MKTIVDDPAIPSGQRVLVRDCSLFEIYFIRVAGTIDDGYAGFVLAQFKSVAPSGAKLFQSLPYDGYAGESVYLHEDDEVIDPTNR